MMLEEILSTRIMVKKAIKDYKENPVRSVHSLRIVSLFYIFDL